MTKTPLAERQTNRESHHVDTPGAVGQEAPTHIPDIGKMVPRKEREMTIKLTPEDYEEHDIAFATCVGGHHKSLKAAADALAARLESRLVGPLEATDEMARIYATATKLDLGLHSSYICKGLNAALAAAPWRDAAHEIVREKASRLVAERNLDHAFEQRDQVVAAKDAEIDRLGKEVKKAAQMLMAQNFECQDTVLQNLQAQRRFAEKDAEIERLKAENEELSRSLAELTDRISPYADLERAVVEAALIGIVKAREQGVRRVDLSHPQIWDAIEALEAARKPKTQKQSLWVWTDGITSKCDYYNDGEGLPDYGRGDWYLVPGKTREVEVNDD